MMNDPNLSSESILRRFTKLSAIPRPSRHEDRVLAWLKTWADGLGFEHRSDAAGNLCVRVPASPGKESSPSVALQGHVDMVCEKTPDSAHDFMRDPIKLIREGDWLRADGTTLGADNGIAVAMMMTLAETKGLTHPPLELLFTIDEETGLNGAKELDPALLTSRRLINLDSEDEGVFTIGCAGGSGTQAVLDIRRETDPGWKTIRITVEGLQGGHSGVDIHLGRANAIKVLAESLVEVKEDILLRSFEGGQAHNAIPRSATATIAVGEDCDEEISAPREMAGIIESHLALLKQRFSHTEPDFRTLVTFEDNKTMPLTAGSTRAVLKILADLPHGVLALEPSQKGLVETSANLAQVRLNERTAEIGSSQRSIRMDRLAEIDAKVAAIFKSHGAKIKTEGGYPSWTPDFSSPLLATCRQLHEKLSGAPPRIEVIHAGLECGVIGSRIPGMDMISFGPTIRHPHSPAERADIPSMGRVLAFTAALLAAL